ncbi:expressed unknown protein [Seminavis robusta]|uniref:Uncharacterized protein n=1 Tax=Seminavis robusta TaxID=568900 RepID=A0A9N8H4P4_9STRA|nr:expressed unknown protein [Seminavis robusta]|eukprot:Sro11_g008630.1 n/a (204) ;mRNA; f:105264-105875
MPIPEYVYVMHGADDDDDAFLSWSDEDNNDRGSHQMKLARDCPRHSMNSLQTRWSRWDASHAAVSGSSADATKINFDWGQPNGTRTNTAMLSDTVPSSVLDRLSSAANIPVHNRIHAAEEKLTIAFPKPGVITKARSLPRSDSKMSSKLRSSPPKLRSSPPKLPRSSRCACAPPKPPVRRLSMAISETSECDCDAKKIHSCPC